MDKLGAAEVSSAVIPIFHLRCCGDLLGPEKFDPEGANCFRRQGEAVVEAALVRKSDVPLLKDALRGIKDLELRVSALFMNTAIFPDSADESLKVNFFSRTVESSVGEEQGCPFMRERRFPLNIHGKAPHGNGGEAAIEIYDEVVRTEGSSQVALLGGPGKEGNPRLVGLS